jgi:ribosomal protein S3
MKGFNKLKAFMFIAIAKIFGLKYEIESKKYRRAISQYFYWKEWGYETTITQIKVYRKAGKITILIETHRPGLLIGKAGHFIDSLKEHLCEELKEDISISLKECKLWHNLH